MQYVIGKGLCVSPGAKNMAQLLGKRVMRPAEGGGISGTGLGQRSFGGVGCPCGGKGPVCRCGTGNIPIGVSGEFTDAAKWGAGWVVGGVAALWLISKVLS